MRYTIKDQIIQAVQTNISPKGKNNKPSSSFSASSCLRMWERTADWPGCLYWTGC